MIFAYLAIALGVMFAGAMAGLLLYMRRQDRASMGEVMDRFAAAAGERDAAMSALSERMAVLTERFVSALDSERAHVERIVAVSKAGCYAETQPGYMESVARQAEAAAKINANSADPFDEAEDRIGRETDRDLEARFPDGNLPVQEGD